MSIFFRILALIGGIGLIGRWLSKRNSFEAKPAQDYIRQLKGLTNAMRNAEGQIHLQLADREGEAKIHAGTSFTTIDSTPLISSSETEISFPAPSAARQYFRILWPDGHQEYIAERSIPNMGVENLRDIGGYPTKDGGTIAWNKVYRGASLAEVDDEELIRLQELGIKLICDMRSSDEIEEDPDRVPAGSSSLHLPAMNNNRRLRQLSYILFDRRNLDKVMFDLYSRVMIDQNEGVFRQIFERVANADNLPMLIHCAAGKDRTGLATALLLLYLGVPEEIVIADYSFSNASYDYFRRISQKAVMPLARVGIGIDDVHAMILADPEVMRATIGHIYEKYGSVEAYLINHAGLSQETLQQVRTNLLSQ